MNGFLVDTNVISEILRSAPDARVAAWSQRAARPMLFLSVVSMGELRKGVTILPASARRTHLEKSIESQVPHWFEGRILPVTQAIAERWGELDGTRQMAGRPLNAPDGGSAWSQQSLTQATHGASAETSYGDSWIAACVSGNYQFVFFASPDLHLHEFSYINNWVDTDLTGLTGLTTAGSAAAFITPGPTQEINVYYNYASGHVHEFWSSIVNLEDNGDYDLTALTGASTAVEGAVGFATTPNDQQHFYTRANNGVEQFYFNGSSWIAEDLAGGNYWKPYGLAGFAVGNLQHLYYLANSN